MRIKGNVNFERNGLAQSIGAMHLDTEIFSIASENIMGFDKIGYKSYREYDLRYDHQVVGRE